ncbi:MAG: DUF488 domain-containing protein [Betaproteobacteria bacterium]
MHATATWAPPGRIWTIGHSTLAADDFLALLAAHSIEIVADVRRFPASRRHPQFNSATLSRLLSDGGVGYVHLAELGGRRAPAPDSINTGWRDPGFRGYADYMQTPLFGDGMARLLDAATQRPCAVMCAERHWTSCHRGLIADALKVSGIEVMHIVDAGRVEIHPWTKPARIVDGLLTYTPASPLQASLDL